MKDNFLVEDVYGLNQGDPKSFKNIYDALYPEVFVAARDYLELEDAKDITATVFCKLWEKRSDINSVQHVKGFLFMTLRNACLNFIKRDNRIQWRRRQLIQDASIDPAQEFELSRIKAELYQVALKELDRIPPQARRIFELSVFQGLENHEIAKLLGLTIQTVKNQKNNAVKKLRLALGNDMSYILLLIFLGKFLGILN